METKTAEEEQVLRKRFWELYKEEDIKYGEDYHDAGDVRILAERALQRFVSEVSSQYKSRIEELEKENGESDIKILTLQDTIESQRKRIETLEGWLTAYRNELKKTNVFHKNEGIIKSLEAAINPLSNGE